MSKRTLTKIIRTFDAIPTHKIGKGKEAVQQYRYEKRAVPFPPMPRKEQIVKCGTTNVHILVSEGQIINEAKVCKRFNARMQK